jgi:hypothetical protein
VKFLFRQAGDDGRWPSSLLIWLACRWPNIGHPDPVHRSCLAGLGTPWTNRPHECAMEWHVGSGDHFSYNQAASGVRPLRARQPIFRLHVHAAFGTRWCALVTTSGKSSSPYVQEAVTRRNSRARAKFERVPDNQSASGAKGESPALQGGGRGVIFPPSPVGAAQIRKCRRPSRGSPAQRDDIRQPTVSTVGGRGERTRVPRGRQIISLSRHVVPCPRHSESSNHAYPAMKSLP